MMPVHGLSTTKTVFNEQDMQNVLLRLEQFEQEGLSGLQELIDTYLEPLLEPLDNLQPQIDNLAREVNQLGADFRNTVQQQIEVKIQALQSTLLQPVEEQTQQAQQTIDSLEQTVQSQVDDLLEHLQTAKATLDNLLEPVESLKAQIKEEITEQREAFTEEVSDISDTMLEKLEEQLTLLTDYIEDWIARSTGMGNEKVHQALIQQTETLSTQISSDIRNLLDDLLHYFDHQVAAAKRALLDAVHEGSASREAIEPALDQLQTVKRLIEEVVEQVRSLGETVGVGF